MMLSLSLSFRQGVFLVRAQKLPGGETKTMPNAKVLSEKQAVVAALAERIRNAGSGVLVDYRGITVAQDTTLRSELRKNDVQYSVIKNTLTRLALDSLGLDALDGVLHGTTSLATSNGDPIAPFRVITDFAKKMPANSFQIKAAFMDGQVLSEEEIARIAALPSKDALYAQVFGTLLAPITSLAVVLNQILEQKNGGPMETEAAAE